MKINLVATLSANGKIFVNPLTAHFKPPQYYLDFVKDLAQTGKNLIIGRKLFEASPEIWLNLHPDIEIIVLSKQLSDSKNYKVVKNTAEATAYFKEKSYTESLIVGGVKTYQAFLEANLVTDLYLDYAPYIISEGGELSAQNHPFMAFKQIEVLESRPNQVRLHLTKDS